MLFLVLVITFSADAAKRRKFICEISHNSDTNQKSIHWNYIYNIQVLLIGRGVSELCDEMGHSYPCQTGLVCESDPASYNYNSRCIATDGK